MENQGLDPAGLYGLAGVPVVLALVELVKASFPNLPARAWPGLSVALGIGFNLLLAAVLRSSALELAALMGLITGLAASGLYSYAKVSAGNGR